MANPRSIAARATQHPELDRSENLALPVQTEEAPGADEVHDVALPLAVDEGYDPPETYDHYTADWRDDYADAVGISRYKEL